MRAGGLREVAGSTVALHRTLEPAALRGGVSSGQQACMGGRPGGGETEIYQGGILPVLAQCAAEQGRYGHCPAAGADAGVLCAGGRRRRGSVEPEGVRLYVLVPAALQAVGGTVAVGTVVGQPDSADVALPDTKRGGLRCGQSEHRLHLAGAHRATDADFQQRGGGVHPGLDLAALGYAHQHRPDFGLPGQADEAAHELLRHEDDGRHPATHQRPYAHPELPDGKQPERGVLYVQHRGVRAGAVALQSAGVRPLYRRQCAVRGLRVAVHEEAGGTGPQAVCPAERESEQRGAAGDGDAGNQAERLRAAEAVGVGTHPGAAVPGEHPESGAQAVSGLGRGAHQPDEERDYHGAGGGHGGAGRHDAGHDGVGAVHHRPVEQSGERTDYVCPRHAGCPVELVPPHYIPCSASLHTLFHLITYYVILRPI